MMNFTPARSEPIAIIGLGCRFPGQVDSWRSYWRLLQRGGDAITETPAERWNLDNFYAPEQARPGKTHSRWGGYVEGIELFDPQLFGISPREAASMDPQQRMLLEVAYRALEDAGQPLERLAGEPVAVFVGISSFDYAVAGLSFQDRGVIDAYSNTGGSSSIAANRISYCFDLRGASVAVDTACSSSLVAVHLACESIWRGESPLALAGGVNALLLPDFYVAFSQLGVLSPDGRCKSFDARANGYVRSEGAGMVLLKPLSAALRDRDPVYAVIRSTALNQDGRTPGMTVPSQAAQEQLIRDACRKAGVAPGDIQYVEAHGTGTPVGDPIEAAAIGSVIGRSRPAGNPCWLGSVKTNIGHLEAGAGIASLIKVALSLHHAQIPANVHFQHPNPKIDLAGLNLQIPCEAHPWTVDGPRLAGINGFGYGGANAHVILQQAPQAAVGPDELAERVGPSTIVSSPAATLPASTQPFTAPVLWPVSARTRPALIARAQQLAHWLAQQPPELSLAEVAGYMAQRRTHHECRAAVTATSREEMITELTALAAHAPEDLVSSLASSQLARGLAFICSGQGPQWWGMGRGLLTYSSVFRGVIKRCDAEFARYGDWSLMQELLRSEKESRLHKTALAQPCIFAIQVALAKVWESWGITPTAVVGHSVGEIAAAYLTGALSFEDAARVAFHRGRSMDLASSQGGMLAAGLSLSEVQQWLRDIDSEVAVAAINGPASVTISGEAQAIKSLAQRLERAGVFCRTLAVEYAFHSPQMEPVRDELLRSLDGIRPQATHTDLISTVTGQTVDGVELGPEYWWKNVRLSVRFHEAMQTLAEQGYSVAVEVGPHPVLAYAINECFQAAGKSVCSVPSLNRQQDDLLCMSKSLGTLYSLGVAVRWSGFYNPPARRLELPEYPFQQQRCWSESLESQITRLAPPAHPLLGSAVVSPQPQWQQRIDLKLQTYLQDHRVRETVVYPGAAILETAWAAAQQVLEPERTGQRGSLQLKRVRLLNPCVLADDRPQWIQTSWDGSRRQLHLACRPCDDQEWRELATLDVSRQSSEDLKTELEGAFRQRLHEVQQRCRDEFDAQRLYAHCRRIGLQYGRGFQGVRRGQRRAGEAILEINLPLNATDSSLARTTYGFHPALLDSCFHGMIAADPDFDHTVDGLYLPSEIAQVICFRPATEQLTAIVSCPYKSPQLMRCDLDIFDSSGRLCLSLRGFESRRITAVSSAESIPDLVYGYQWLPRPLAASRALAMSQAARVEAAGATGASLQGANLLESSAPEDWGDVPARRWLLFMDQGGVGTRLAARLRQAGEAVLEAYHADGPASAASAGGSHAHVRCTAEDVGQALQVAAAKFTQPVDEIVYLWGLDAPQASAVTADNLEESTRLTCWALVRLVQACESLQPEVPIGLTLVTCGGQSADSQIEQTEIAQAPLIGLGRVIASEIASLRVKLVDLPAAPADADIEGFYQELLVHHGEDEIQWRGGQRWVHRFEPLADQPLPRAVARGASCQLSVGKSAGIEELRYLNLLRRELSAGEVEIEVLATGLNFSDVMKGLDLYPGLPDGPPALGAECSGRISRVGPGVAWRVGEEVVAVAPGAFATHVIVRQELVARKPSRLSHSEAAALPIAFLTAEYALQHCAHLQPGETVLIHAASGGVGMAAMQLALRRGARVLATAGSDEKRRVAAEAGAELVMDSRTLAFGEQTLRATGGQGVDVVLNSLAGEAIGVGLEVLKPGGRFLEIGKRDIYNDAPLGLFPFRNNLALFAIDLDQLFKTQPQRMGELLRQLVERFERGELQPVPTQSFPAEYTAEAFRQMQQSKHVGKIVVDFQRPPFKVWPSATGHWRFEEAGTFWLVGGLGGFGLEIARWLVERGVRSLVLSGRNIPPEAATSDRVTELQRAGAQVHLIPCDIGVAGDVRQVLETIREQLPPLRGIVHTAMVLEDKLLNDLQHETLSRVLRPKLIGGWNLHHETLGLELEYFILFSSLSSVFGHAGQANYSAANAALDSLAYYRRAQGLPATVINWGHLGEVGYLAERTQLGERLERQGVLSFSVQQATACLEYALLNRLVQMSVLRMDWSLWRGLGITHRVSPRFAHLLQAAPVNDSLETQELPSAGSLRSMSEASRGAAVERLVRRKLGGLLGIGAEKIPADRSLLELGLDSLMAVELRNWLEAELELNVPIASLMRSDSLSMLVGELQVGLGVAGGRDPQPTPVAAPAVTQAQAAELLERLPHLAEEQVTQLLAEMLRDA